MNPRLILWLAAGAMVPARVGAQDSSGTRFAHVVYLTTATAYLDAGRDDGVGDSARVDIVRGGAVVATLKVAFLSPHRAACTIPPGAPALVVGDLARFVRSGVARDTAAVAATPPPPPHAAHLARGPSDRLRGRIGAEYLVVGQTSGGSGFSQPALDLRVDGRPFAASGVALSLDVRARRTYTILPDGSAVTDSRTRVYQAALSFNSPGAPARLTVGRQISGNLASIGVFDGGMFELTHPAWSFGLFTGTEPEPLQLDFSSSVTQFGFYVQRHSRPGANSRWAITLGASDSYDSGQPDREFGYFQASYLTPRLTFLLTQEVDYYRPWKLMAGMEEFSPTSTFALLRYRLFGPVTFDAGIDNRRNVRLYRDVVNPATNFDDTFRQGVWGGLTMRMGSHARIGWDARSSSGGAAGKADAYTMSWAVERISHANLILRGRSTWYQGPDLNGWLHAVALGIDPGSGRIHLEVNGGERQELDPTANPVARVWATWIGGDLDIALARAWYIMFSGTRETGGFEGNDQLDVGLSYRF